MLINTSCGNNFFLVDKTVEVEGRVFYLKLEYPQQMKQHDHFLPYHYRLLRSPFLRMVLFWTSQVHEKQLEIYQHYLFVDAHHYYLDLYTFSLCGKTVIIKSHRTKKNNLTLFILILNLPTHHFFCLFLLFSHGHIHCIFRFSVKNKKHC